MLLLVEVTVIFVHLFAELLVKGRAGIVLLFHKKPFEGCGQGAA